MPARKKSQMSPTWCMDQLWERMELNLTNRVEAKTGRSNKLETNHLSNIMSHAALAHPTKPINPIFPTRLKRLAETGITIQPEQKMALREVFMFYCSWAEKHNFLFMSSSQFLRCCKDIHLVTLELDTVALSIMFEKVQLHSPDPAPGSRITFTDWLQLLQKISLLVSPHMSPQEAWDAIVSDHVLMFGQRVDCSHDEWAQVLNQADVLEALQQARPKLRPLFDFYVKEQIVPAHQQSPAQPPAQPSPPAVATAPSPRLHVQLPSSSGLFINTSSCRPTSPGAAANALAEAASSSPRTPSVSCRMSSVCGGEMGRISLASALDSPSRASFTLPSGLLIPGDTGSRLSHASRAASPTLPGARRPSSQAGRSQSIARSTAKVQQAKSQMPLPTFVQLLQDFDVLPQLITKAEASLCFRSARFKPGHGDEEGADVGRIDFSEFMEAMARVALKAYQFQLPTHPEQLLVFQDSYHQGAKHLWSSHACQSLKDSLCYPDVVVPPVADREGSIGVEDAAHYDDGAASVQPDRYLRGGQSGIDEDAGSRCATRSIKSRAGGIFRTALSLAPYRQKHASGMCGGGGEEPGAEILAVHNGLPDMETDRPVHLRAFTTDWVGRPPAPLRETALLAPRWPDQALSSGIYNSCEIGLPPVFKQRQLDMEEARAHREQAAEALKLLYVSARRQQQRQAVQATQQKRLALQAATGLSKGARQGGHTGGPTDLAALLLSSA